jgi:hypothetical protein
MYGGSKIMGFTLEDSTLWRMRGHGKKRKDPQDSLLKRDEGPEKRDFPFSS